MNASPAPTTSTAATAMPGVLCRLAVAAGDGAARAELDDDLDPETLGQRRGLGRAAQQHRLVLAGDHEIAALGELAQDRRGLLFAPQPPPQIDVERDTHAAGAREL